MPRSTSGGVDVILRSIATWTTTTAALYSSPNLMPDNACFIQLKLIQSPFLDFMESRGGYPSLVIPGVPQPNRFALATKVGPRGCFLLRLQDRVADAEWMDSLIRCACPEPWEKRDQWFYNTARDPKLAHLLKGILNISWIPTEVIPSGQRRLRVGRDNTK